MGLNARINPQGVDVVIDRIQRDLFIELTKKFGWRDYDSYDRAYRNKKGNDKLPEVYTGNEEYKEVLFNDKQTVTSFWLVDEKRNYSATDFKFEQGISLIVQADLSKLFPSIKHRPDEELIDNVCKAIKNKFWQEKLIEIIQGVEQVYNTLKVDINEHSLNDMGSFSIVRFNFKVQYTNTNCSTQPIR